MLAALDKHPHARAVLGGVLDAGRTPSHAYLFHGPGGSGKREVARLVAATLLSAGSPDAHNAFQRAMAGSHPDLTWVSPSGAHELLVSDIDQPVVAAAVKTPFESARRVFVIESVDQLGDEAANRMLKTLEEPASYVHLILVSDQLGEVLPTIRSRCQLVRFDGPSVPELVAELVGEGVPAEAAEAYARLSLGDAGRARELAAPEGVALRAGAEAYVRAAVAMASGASGAAPAGQPALPWKGLLEAVRARGERLRVELDERMATELELVPRKERKRLETEWGDRIKRGRRRVETGALELALTVVSAWLLDLAALSWGGEDLVRNVDRLVELRSDLEQIGSRANACVTAAELVEDTRTRFQLNVSEELALEALAYRLERALAR
jgi:DNA polymerase III subunit delta'